MKRTCSGLGLSFLLLSIMIQSVSADINTRLQFVSNEGGELVFNVQAMSTVEGGETAGLYDHSVNPSMSLTAVKTGHAFSNRYYPAIIGETPSGIGMMSYSYEDLEEPIVSIPDSWVTIVTITVYYTPTEGTGSVVWGDDYGGTPFKVEAEAHNPATNITGTMEDIPASLTDFSLPVELSTFTADHTPDMGVKLLWRTESETNSEGFHIWRNEMKAGDYTKITTQIISSQGNSSDAREYTYVDRTVRNEGYYWYQLEQIDMNGANRFYGPVMAQKSSPQFIPSTITLSQNYPNPFSISRGASFGTIPATQIRYDLAEEVTAVLKVYTLLGKEVRTLVNKQLPAGSYTVTWDGKDDNGMQLSSGVYIYKLAAGQEIKMGKMIKVE